ncbi:hypothetical protein LTR08_006953 [Meristemomyces frigidus]|nr:hypothetical protein LTR08_006953 [Meristemomyces frigidus]
MKVEHTSGVRSAAAALGDDDVVSTNAKRSTVKRNHDFVDLVSPPRRKEKRPIDFIDLVTDDDDTPPRPKKRAADVIDDTPHKRQKQKQQILVKECMICCEEIPAFGFPEAPHYDGEKCASSVCFSCWELHLEIEVESKKWNDIKCPECGKLIIEEELKMLALQDTYAS